MRTATEIKNELKERRAWATRQNEIQGGAYDYHDRPEINNLLAELDDAEKAEWTRDVTIGRRAECKKIITDAKKAGIKLTAVAAQNYVESQIDYKISALNAAIKRHGLD